MFRIVSILSILAAFVFLTACDRSIEAHVYPTVFSCEKDLCDVRFDVENLTDNALLLNYEGKLTQNYINVPSNSGIVDVGHFVGELTLSPHERKTILRQVVIDEPANGSRVSISMAAR